MNDNVSVLRCLTGVVVIILFVTALLFVADTNEPPTAHYDVSTFQDMIRTDGPQAAYEAYKLTVKTASLGEQHSLGHAFGAALYAEVGGTGFGVCDVRVDGGCIHQFFGEYAYEHGLDSLDVLLEQCDKGTALFVHCVHSLGHAFVAHFGYTPTDLETALALCDTYEHETENCYDGAFMEYDQRLVADHNLMTARDFDADRPYEPCDALPEKYAHACYYRITRVWNLNMLDHTLREKYRDMGALCRGLDPVYQKKCASSIGAVMDYDGVTNAEAAKELCASAFAGTELQTECIVGFGAVERRLFLKDEAYELEG